MGSIAGGTLQTLYESREKKGIKIKFNSEVATEIESYLTGLNEMIEAYKDSQEIVDGLQEIKVKANALLVSHASEDEIVDGIRNLATVEGPGGKKMKISAFRKKSSEQVKDPKEFQERTLRLIEQTTRNTIALMQWASENQELGAFLNQVKSIDRNLPVKDLDRDVKDLIKSEGFQAYQNVKESYLKEWLKPFQELLGKPVEALSQEELQEAMKRMKIVMKQRMTEGNLIVHPESDKFQEFNMHDHDMVNGYEKTFWQNDLLLDEFIQFTQAVLSRFTFLLDKQFLVFQFREEPYLYLIGFSHDAFLNAEQTADGTMLIAPHVKTIIPGKDKTFRELNKSSWSSLGLYMDMLRETLKPFFQSLGEKIDFEFSKEFKRHFRM